MPLAPVTPDQESNSVKATEEIEESLESTPPTVSGSSSDNDEIELIATATQSPTEDNELVESSDNTDVDTGSINSESTAGGIPIESFSASTSETIPENILQEIWFFSGGDGDSGCFGFGDYTQPIVVSSTEEILLHEIINIRTCGWQKDEKVQIEAMFPDGTLVTSEAISTGLNPVQFYYKTSILEDTSGMYSVVFYGESGSVEALINVVTPSIPHVYWEDNGDVILYDFQPDEHVTLFAYMRSDKPVDEFGNASYVLYGWQEYQVNHNGQIIIQTEPELGWIAVLGEFSGEITPSYPSSERLFGGGAPSILASFYNNDVSPTWPTSDTNDEACHLLIGNGVSVTENTRVWSKPNVIDGQRLSAIPEGSTVTVTSGPAWGRIRTDTDASGWWWEVNVDTEDISGWIWEERIVSCQAN